MKITYIILNFGSGGKERQLLYLVQNLAKTDQLQMIILGDNIFYKEIYDVPMQLITYRLDQRYKLSTLYRINKAISDFKPDIIHTWDNLPHCFVLPYIVRSKVKVVNGSIRYATTLKKRRIVRILKKVAFTFSHKIVSNSKAGLFVENLQSSKKSQFIHNGFDLDNFLNKQSVFPEDIEKIIHNFQTSIVMVASFYAPKDYLTFVLVAKKIVQNHPEVAFFCIGDGPDRPLAEEDAGPMRGKNIYFMGRRNDVHHIIHAFDIGVLLNNTNGYGEGISNAIMEYMAAGLPVVATNAGGTPELIKDNESGFLVPAFNPEIVMSRISSLLKDEKMRIQMGQKGKEIIKNDFNVTKMISSYRNLYKSILDGKA